jgi:hypothetical protein
VITTSFAFRVLDLQRQGLTVAAIARELGADEADVLEAPRMLNLTINDASELCRVRTDAGREAQLDRMPKRMQDRILRSRT